jgi:hypothetical protein
MQKFITSISYEYLGKGSSTLPNKRPLTVYNRVLKLSAPGTPDEVKEKSDAPIQKKKNMENTHPTFVLLIEKKVYRTALLYEFSMYKSI